MAAISAHLKDNRITGDHNVIELSGAQNTAANAPEVAISKLVGVLYREHSYSQPQPTLGIKIQTAAEILSRRKSVIKISSGCTALDNLLDGGFESQAITELVGESGSGKSQIAYTLCARLQGYSGYPSALFIDADGTFSPERVRQIAEERQLPWEEVLKNTLVSRAHNIKRLSYIIGEAFEIVHRENIRLIVIDSLSSCLHAENGQIRAEKRQKLHHTLNRLVALSQLYNVPVLITNKIAHVTRAGCLWPGNVLSSMSTHHVQLTRRKDGVRVASLSGKSHSAKCETFFKISSKGIEDIPMNSWQENNSAIESRLIK